MMLRSPLVLRRVSLAVLGCFLASLIPPAAPAIAKPAAYPASTVASAPPRALPEPARALPERDLPPATAPALSSQAAPATQSSTSSQPGDAQEALLSQERRVSASDYVDFDNGGRPPFFAVDKPGIDDIGINGARNEYGWEVKIAEITNGQKFPRVPQWIEVDLGDIYNLRRLSVDWISSNSSLTIDYDVIVGNESGQGVIVASGDNAPRKFEEFIAVSGRYVQLRITDVHNLSTDGIEDSIEVTALNVYGVASISPDAQNPAQDCNCPPPQPERGGPFNTQTGFYWYEDTDLLVESAGPLLTWQRTYSSRTIDETTDNLSDGWNHRYGDSLILPGMQGAEDGLIIHVTDKGNKRRYQDLNGMTENIDTSGFPGVYSELIRFGTGYVLKNRDQSQHFFDADGRLTKIRDPQNRDITLTYDSSDRLSRIADAQNPQRYLQLQYDGAATRVSGVTDGRRTISYTYDPTTGNLEEVRGLRGPSDITTYEYTSRLLTKVINPLGQTIEATTFEQPYTAASRVIGQTLQDGRILTVAYQPNQTTIITQYPSGESETEIFRYDATNTLIGIEQNGVETRTSTYDQNFAPGRLADANGNTTTTAFNDQGKPTSMTNALGLKTGIEYDELGRAVVMTDTMNRRTELVYYTPPESSVPNLLKSRTTGITKTIENGQVVNYPGFETTYTYNGPWLQTEQGPNGVVTRYDRDTQGQVTTKTVGYGLPEAQITTYDYGYDAFGKVLTTTVGVNTPLERTDSTRFNWDGTLRKTILNYVNGEFDSAITDEDIVTEYGYDLLGRRIWVKDVYGRYDATYYNPQGQVERTVRNLTGFTGGNTLPQPPAFDADEPDANVSTIYGYDGDGRVTVVTQTGILTGSFNPSTWRFTGAPTTRVTRTSYDDFGRPITVIFNYKNGQFDPEVPDEDVTTEMRYDAQGNVVKQIDALGRRVRTYYDELNRPWRVIQNYENGDPFSVCGDGSANGSSLQRCDWDENTVLDDNRAWASVVNNDTDIEQRTFYTDDGQVDYVIDNYVDGVFDPRDPANDRVTRYKYDPLGRVELTIRNYVDATPGDGDPFDSIESNLPDPVPGDPNAADPYPNDTNVITRMAYDDDNNIDRVVGVADTLGRWVNQQYDGLGRPWIATQNCVALEGQQVAAVASGCDPALATSDRNVRSETQYDDLGRVLATIDPMSIRTQTLYDELGRTLSVIQNYDPNEFGGSDTNVAVSQTYDALGRTVTMTDGVSEVSSYDHDRLGRTISVTDPELRITRMGYDGTGAQRWMRTPDGRYTVMELDGLGRVVATIQNYQDGVAAANEPVDQDLIVRTKYDAAGRRVATVDAIGRETRFGYDLRDQLVQVVENAADTGCPEIPCNVVTRYRFDRAGNRTEVIDAHNLTTQQMEYDAADRKVKAEDGRGIVTGWSYNRLGQLITQDDPRGQSNDLSYAYDALNRLVGLSAQNLPDAPGSPYNIEWVYTPRGERDLLIDSTGTTDFRYDDLGRIDRIDAPNTGAIEYGYNARGDRTSLVYPDGSTIDYEYHGDGQLKEVRQNYDVLASYLYDPAGRLETLVRANGTLTSYAYDGADRLRDLHTTRGGSTLARFAYEVDRRGLREAVTETFQSDATATPTSTATSTPTPTTTSTPQPTVLDQINAGGAQVTVNGSVWDADRNYTGGRFATAIDASIDIANTSEDAIYRSARTSSSGSNSFSYAIPVPAAGTYTLKLHFAEIYFTGLPNKGPAEAGRRVFSVNLEGGAVELANYDINADVGPLTAAVKTFNVAVSDGTLSIDLISTVDKPLLNAITVLSASGPAPSPTATHTATATPTATRTATPTTTAATPTPTATSTPVAGTSTVRVNTGGSAQTVGSTTWAACTSSNCNGYVATGFTYSVSGATIQNVPAGMNEAIFRSEWAGTASVGATAFTFGIPVSNGGYTVKLHFAELTRTGAGQRQFDVRLEGTTVLSNFDIFAEAGQANSAITREFPITVTDGAVTLAFVKRIENPKISAIEIVPAASGQQSGQASLVNESVASQEAPAPRTGAASQLYLPALARQPVAAARALTAPDEGSDTAAQRADTVASAAGMRILANTGQHPAAVRFQAEGMGGSLFFLTDGFAISVPVFPEEIKRELRPGRWQRTPEERTRAYRKRLEQYWKNLPQANARLTFLGSAANPTIIGTGQLASVAHSLVGRDPAGWRSNIPLYSGVQYEALYPGIDLHYENANGQGKTTYVVAEGASPTQIRWRYDGARSVRVTNTGDLQVVVPVRHPSLPPGTTSITLTERAPIAWQQIDGRQVAVNVRYRVEANQAIRFELGAYDARYPLVIDPVITFSTYLGGDGFDSLNDVTVDADGNIYLVGATRAATFGGAPGNTTASIDVVVAKLAPDGQTLLSITYLGGGGADRGFGIARGSDGAIYLTGSTSSENTFPVQNPKQATGGSTEDAFITKLDSTLSTILYSSYFGGSGGSDWGERLVVDAQGTIYIAGVTYDDTSFPVSLPQASTLQSDVAFGDAFVLKVAPNGDILAAAPLGGSDSEFVGGLAVDGAGNIVVVGGTWSSDFPQADSYLPWRGYIDGFITKIAADFSDYIYSTYLGTEQADVVEDVAVDPSGSAYVIGDTGSDAFPVVNALHPVAPSDDFGGSFIARLTADGQSLDFSTYIGGSNIETGSEGLQIELDGQGSIVFAGHTSRAALPSVPANQSPVTTPNKLVVGRLTTDGQTLTANTYLAAGDGGTWLHGLALDAGNKAVLAGNTSAVDFPVINALQPAHGDLITEEGSSYADGDDGFVVKVALDPPPVTATTSRQVMYDYDGLQRLTDAAYSTGETYEYGYDLAGNREAVWVNGTRTVNLTFDAANRVTQGTPGWAYDLAGNVTSDSTTTYTYDALNRVTQQGAGAAAISYTYNGDSVLVGQAGPSTTASYAQDLAAPLTQVLNDGTANYLYGMERLSTLGANPTWYVGDALGSVRMTLGTVGAPLDMASYDPWGTPESGLIAPFGFTGELQDEQGLVHLRARWYNPATATLLSRDPFAGFAEQPYSLNPYQYAYSNPVLLTDPSGKNPLFAAVIIGGFIYYLGYSGALTPITQESQRLYDNAARGIGGLINDAGNAVESAESQFLAVTLQALINLSNRAWEQEGFSLDPTLSVWEALVFVVGGISCYLRTDQFGFDTLTISDLYFVGASLAALSSYISTAHPFPVEEAFPVLASKEPPLPTNPDLQWIRDKHSRSGEFWDPATKSYFYDDLSDWDYLGMFDAASDVKPYQQENGNWVWITETFDGAFIGRTWEGVDTAEFTIIIDPNGNLVSMFPGRPGKR